MGLDWCVQAGADGISPAVKIGCRRFSRNDAELVAMLADSRKQNLQYGRSGDVATARKMAAIETLFLVDQGRVFTLGEVAHLASTIGLSGPIGDSQQALSSAEVLRAAEWLFAGLYSLPGEEVDHYTLHWMGDLRFGIWIADWLRKYYIETATEKIPEGEGSFVAGPLSFRGKILQYCGLPESFVEKCFEGGDASWMEQMASKLRGYAKNMKSPARAENRKDCEDAATWLEFWAKKDVEIFAWY